MERRREHLVEEMHKYERGRKGRKKIMDWLKKTPGEALMIVLRING